MQLYDFKGGAVGQGSGPTSPDVQHLTQMVHVYMRAKLVQGRKGHRSLVERDQRPGGRKEESKGIILGVRRYL